MIPNKVFGHPRSEESILLLSSFLVKHHLDKDADSLFVRFNELLKRIEALECDAEATHESYLRVAKILKQANAICDL